MYVVQLLWYRVLAEALRWSNPPSNESHRLSQQGRFSKKTSTMEKIKARICLKHQEDEKEKKLYNQERFTTWHASSNPWTDVRQVAQEVSSWELNDNPYYDWYQFLLWYPQPDRVSASFIRLWLTSRLCLHGFYFNLSVSGFCISPLPRISGVCSILGITSNDS
jgi:hypothetical protein